MPSLEKEALTIEPWQAGIALATLLLVGGVTVFTAWDRMHSAEVEDVVTPTAVGDMHYVQEPKGRTGGIGLKYQGQKLDMVSESKIRDARLVRVGTDDSGVYSVYRSADDKGLAKDHFFMKMQMNEFIEVREE